MTDKLEVGDRIILGDAEHPLFVETIGAGDKQKIQCIFYNHVRGQFEFVSISQDLAISKRKNP
jgi:hypothetical protein